MDRQEQPAKRRPGSDDALRPVDGCGCGQSPTATQRTVADHQDAPLTVEPAALPTVDTPVAPVAVPADAGRRRGIKLVITLQPQEGEGTGYRALLAVGTEGCDPLLRSIEVIDLPAALDELPGLVAEATARWQVQPRYPATVPTTPRRATPVPAAPKPRQGQDPSAGPAQASGPSATPVAPATPPPTKPGAHTPSPDQLSLFG